MKPAPFAACETILQFIAICAPPQVGEKGTVWRVAARGPSHLLRVGLTGCFIVGMLSDKPCSVNVFNTETSPSRRPPQAVQAVVQALTNLDHFGPLKPFARRREWMLDADCHSG